MTWRRWTSAFRSLRLGIFSSLVALAIPWGDMTRGEDIAVKDGTMDCGTMALYALLRLEGHPAEPVALSMRLRPSSDAGPSLKELRGTASAYGMTLRGVLLNKDKRSIDRPMIVFLKRAQHGHFQVLRPVGHTGELVQVIDANTSPFVVDKVALFAAPEWTGIALIPERRRHWPTRIALAVIGGAAVAGLGWITLRWRREVQGGWLKADALQYCRCSSLWLRLMARTPHSSPRPTGEGASSV